MPLNEVALAEAKKALRITDIFFRDEKVTLDPAVTPPFWPPAGKTLFRMVTRILHDFKAEVEEEGGDEKKSVRFIEVEFVGAVRCVREEPAEDQHDLLHMEVSLGLLYEVRQECSDEGIDEFVRMNVPYHAIPYWREHVHAVCAKRRFAPITVPLYNRAIQHQEPAALGQGQPGQPG